jgi:hypothetical protein
MVRDKHPTWIFGWRHRMVHHRTVCVTKIGTCYCLTLHKLSLENIGSAYPFYVYGGNRPLAPILRQRRCSLLYDVYWLAWWWLMFNGIKIPGIQFQNQKMNDEMVQYNNKLNNNWITITGDGQLRTSTNNHKCQLKKVEMWVSNICIGLNIFVIT